MTSSCTNIKPRKKKRNKNGNDNDNNNDDDDDEDNDNFSREEVLTNVIKMELVTRNLYLLTCVLIYLLSYPLISYLGLIK